MDNRVRKYAFQWSAVFNLNSLRAIIAVSEDDTFEFDKKPLHEKTNFTPFSSFSFFYMPIFMIGKNIGAAAATPTPMQFYAVF